MQDTELQIGIVGGTGMLGRTIAKAVLDRALVPPDHFWISNRTGAVGGFSDFPGLKVTTDNQQLAAACDVIILSVPPAHKNQIAIHAPNKLIISVMAGVSVETLMRLTGSSRVIRAMCSPAAEIGLAYSPWFPSPAITQQDQQRTNAIFGACGATDKVARETDIEVFTALTGPVPGFVALFAEAMIDYATSRGIAPDIADRAIRQLFVASGKRLAAGHLTAAEHVNQMIDYAGTTAAGLEAMKRLSIDQTIFEGLDAAVSQVKKIG